MKRSPLPFIILIIVLTLPFLLWSVSTQNADVRSRADLSTTPTVTLTPTITLTVTPTSTPSATPTITPTPTNIPPRCNGISVKPGSGPKPLTVNFSCAGYDPDNDITAAEFGFGGDAKRLVEKNIGQFGSITTTYTYTETGTYRVTCQLQDNNQAYSGHPSFCQYNVVVTGNALTPTPNRTPAPTQTISDEETVLRIPTPTVMDVPPTQIPTPELSTAPKENWWSNEKAAQLIMMIIVSGITIIVALLLHGFFDKRT